MKQICLLKSYGQLFNNTLNVKINLTKAFKHFADARPPPKVGEGGQTPKSGWTKKKEEPVKKTVDEEKSSDFESRVLEVIAQVFF